LKYVAALFCDIKGIRILKACKQYRVLLYSVVYDWHLQRLEL
jgi:hypothetical protein